MIDPVASVPMKESIRIRTTTIARSDSPIANPATSVSRTATTGDRPSVFRDQPAKDARKTDGRADRKVEDASREWHHSAQRGEARDRVLVQDRLGGTRRGKQLRLPHREDDAQDDPNVDRADVSVAQLGAQLAPRPAWPPPRRAVRRLRVRCHGRTRRMPSASAGVTSTSVGISRLLSISRSAATVPSACARGVQHGHAAASDRRPSGSGSARNSERSIGPEAGWSDQTLADHVGARTPASAPMAAAFTTIDGRLSHRGPSTTRPPTRWLSC